MLLQPKVNLLHNSFLFKLSGQIYGFILKKNNKDSFLFNGVVVVLTPSELLLPA